MAERHVHADRDAAGDEVAQNRGPDPGQLLNRPGTEGGDQGLAQDTIVGR